MDETQTYTYTIRATRLEMLSQGPTPEEDAIVSRHADYLAELAQREVVVFVGRTLVSDERGFGIIVFKAASQAEAERIPAHDPAVAAGVMRAELLPFRLVHMSPAQSLWFEV